MDYVFTATVGGQGARGSITGVVIADGSLGF
jgi:hypothetical protein